MTKPNQAGYEILDHEAAAVLHQQFAARMRKKALALMALAANADALDKTGLPAPENKEEIKNTAENINEEIVARLCDIFYLTARARLEKLDTARLEAALKTPAPERALDQIKDEMTAAGATLDDDDRERGALSFPSQRGLNFTTAQESMLAEAAVRRQEEAVIAEVFGEAQRIYIKMKSEDSPVRVEVEKTLGALGYTITDYKAGYATDQKGKQRFKIGKLLTPFDSYLAQQYSEDPLRTSDNLLIAVSRDPDDIARMSTNRGWGSCMSATGFNFHYVPKDIRDGSLIAYLVSDKDPAITTPLARVLIKPYLRKMTLLNATFGMAARAIGHLKGAPPAAKTAFVVEKCYGLKNSCFTDAIEAFVADALNARARGPYKLKKGLYEDRLNYVRIAPGGQVRTKKWEF